MFFFKLKKKDTIEKISTILDKVDFIFLGENPTQNDLSIFEELKKNCRHSEDFNYICFIIESINKDEVLNIFHKRVYLEFVDDIGIMLSTNFFLLGEKYI